MPHKSGRKSYPAKPGHPAPGDTLSKPKPAPRDTSKSKPLPRRPAPTYPEAPGRKVRKRMESELERLGQHGRNVINTVREGYRRVKKATGR